MCTLKSSATHLLIVSLFGLLNFASEADTVYNTASGNASACSTFQANLNVLLSYLISNATLHDGFYRTNVSLGTPYGVNGLFLCRGDITPPDCRRCVTSAARNITEVPCTHQTENVIWYDVCLLRYSNNSILDNGNMSSPPVFTVSESVPDSDRTRFGQILAATLVLIEQKAVHSTSGKKFATKEADITSSLKLYTLAQCRPDLSTFACEICFEMALDAFTRCCDGKRGATAELPSCTVRYELYRFYNATAESTQSELPSPFPLLRSPSSGKSSTSTIVAIVVPLVLSATIFSFCCYWLRRKAKKSSFKTILRLNFGCDNTTLEGLQLDLVMIKASTNNFSLENKIGRGGFGEVYKGTLSDGQNIAVKRLSTGSKQGLVEFKNEILLIAKLQHRNLVALKGFYLDEQEKILVYEYVANGSLDNFLFGSQQQRKLCWSERYQIIRGIALGILYLHEYSRLKIIHRDLKPSNILLDDNMNPKISDFGMARIVEIDQDRGETNRIVGTYGYMSPEYAMLGQFSEKSDVFSFGVMVLEIISGKKNTNPYKSHHVAEGLTSCVWRQWKDQTPLSILDQNLMQNYSQIEVIRCIQIGLLCVQESPNARPTMATIVSYLNNHSLELSCPQKPAFFLQDRMDRKIATQQESSSGQSANRTTPFSIYEMSISEFYPR